MAIEKDVNGAILYLSSNLSNYVTGANLVIDGGISAKKFRIIINEKEININ